MSAFIAAALPELGSEDRRRFHALGEVQRSQLAYSLLLLEMVGLLEAYLNGRSEFAKTLSCSSCGISSPCLGARLAGLAWAGATGFSWPP